MVYNAEGEHFQPFICHRPNLSEIVKHHFRNDMVFCGTSDGEFSQSVLMEVFKSVER